MDTIQELELRDALLKDMTVRDILLICRSTLTNDQKNTNLYASEIPWGPRPTATIGEAIDHALSII